MIVRIVDLQIEQSEFELAQQLIEEVAPKVRSFEGCSYLELNYDLHKKGHIQTYSRWASEKDLNYYRDSDTFLSFWKKVKPLFARPASAWSFQTRQIDLKLVNN